MLKVLLTAFLGVMVPMISWADIQRVEIKLDISFASEILNEVCGNKDIDEASINRSPLVQNMLTHFVKFRPDFTMDNYISARRAAAKCETTGKDIFRFKEVIARQSQLKTELENLVLKKNQYGEQASSFVNQLSPEDLQYTGIAVPMIGTPSCGGWSSGKTFYLDLPCLKGDQEGLIYLAAHEIYHGIQDTFMPSIDENSNAIDRMFDSIIREGSALHLADFSKIKNPGAYAALNQSVIKTNRGRVSENFDLLEIMVAHLAQNLSNEAYDKVYSIGASGFFDSPFYAIGEVMTTSLRENHGAKATVCLMGLPSQYFFYAYGKLPDIHNDIEDDYVILASPIMDIVRSMGVSEAKLNSCFADSK